MDQFVKRFDFAYSSNVFFSLIIRKDPTSIKKAILDFVCNNDIYQGVSFENILKTYGEEAALYVIDNFDGMCTYTTRKKRINVFKDMLSAYKQGTYKCDRMCKFDSDLHLYIIRERYYNSINYSMFTTEFFTSFSEFASYLSGDLSGADLSKAPITKEEVKNYKTNSTTKFPVSKKYATYKVEKTYSDTSFKPFSVLQTWRDAEGNVVLSKTHLFTHFFNFVHFLKGDLSDADLLLCEGVENIKEIKGLNIKGIKVRSEVAERLGLPISHYLKDENLTKMFSASEVNEAETTENLLMCRQDVGYEGKVSYITDIHLLHRFDAYHCKTTDDTIYVNRVIAKSIGEQATSVNIIGGDTSSDFGVFKDFIINLNAYRKQGDFFFVLGNHELWNMHEMSFEEITKKYVNVLDSDGHGKMHLVQNNIFYFDDGWKEITEDELITISPNDLRAKMRCSKLAIFGGVGFAGANNAFNANSGIYQNSIDRKREIFESSLFFKLYDKVITALCNLNLVVVTHMPMSDWGGKDVHAKEGVVYINGHSHRNYYFDDGKKRIFADNQIGYKGKRLSLKQLPINICYDWFIDYKEGIYEIAKEDYQKFYHGIGECVSFNRQYEKLYMIKRKKTYMFFIQTSGSRVFILNGGSIRKIGEHTLDYYYDNLAKYSESIKLFLSKYDTLQKQISHEIKKIGGSGRIHGCIIDIDFYNHLYLNPIDGTITPYYATSMVDKYVYKNLPSLLKYECPDLYKNFKKLIVQKENENGLIIYDKDVPVIEDKTYSDSTEMYRVSRILKGLQFTTKYSVVRLWNDFVVVNASEENGRLIVTGIINQNPFPSIVEKKYKS